MSLDLLKVPSIAWIARGRLFVKRFGCEIEEIESPFAGNSLQRDLKQSQNNAWKERSGVWGNMGMSPPGMAPWAEVDGRRKIRFVSVTRGASEHELYYALDMGAVGGLFRYDLQRAEESRLMHRQGFMVSDLSRHPVDGQLAVSVARDDGTRGITITRHDGLFGRVVTLSDSIDEAPSWMSDGSKRLIFQSSAIARNEHGVAIGHSNYRIEVLDPEADLVQTQLEEPGFDLLQPRDSGAGGLHFIRRPWKALQKPAPSLLEVAKDVLFFPYRLIRTFVYFFNFMSVMFAGKPLINSSVPQDPAGRVNPYLMLYGQAIDTRAAMKRGLGKDQAGSFVPRDWQLMRKEADGSMTVLAGSVLSYDATPEGHVVYSDGAAIYWLGHGGQPVKLFDGDLIEKVILLASSTTA